MKRNEWLRLCGQRIMDRSDADPGEAAAYARECADFERSKHGDDTTKWMAPADAADEEMANWDTDDQP